MDSCILFLSFIHELLFICILLHLRFSRQWLVRVADIFIRISSFVRRFYLGKTMLINRSWGWHFNLRRHFSFVLLVCLCCTQWLVFRQDNKTGSHWHNFPPSGPTHKHTRKHTNMQWGNSQFETLHSQSSWGNSHLSHSSCGSHLFAGRHFEAVVCSPNGHVYVCVWMFVSVSLSLSPCLGPGLFVVNNNLDLVNSSDLNRRWVSVGVRWGIGPVNVKVSSRPLVLWYWQMHTHTPNKAFRSWVMCSSKCC